jgi:hypothetical protein
MELDTTMTQEVQNVVRVMVQGMSQPEVEQHKCQYCGKSFRRESSLAAHLCEPRRRYQQEKEIGVQLGLQSYLKFYEMAQGVKFGQYLVAIRAINSAMFIEWIIKHNKKLDQWTKEAFYDEYLYDYLRKEHPNDALDRSFHEMQRWADETNLPFNEIFRKGSPNKICNMIVNGRISPWIIFHCDSGVDFLSQLNEEQIAMVFKWIDPEFWQRKFKDHIADAEFIKMVLQESGV